jgi:short-subunit dehydrogenase
MPRGSPAEFRRRYGPWALVVGGSRGLGAALAEALAARGLALLLVARGRRELEQTAAGLRQGYGVEVRELAADVGAQDFLSTLEAAAAGLQIGLLVCNAAATYTGDYLRAPAGRDEEIVRTNCLAAAALCRWLAPTLCRRGRGGILLMSSLAGFQGSPWVTLYGASKAFLMSLGEGLHHELRPRGVDVTAVCPGPTLTPGYIAVKPDPRRRLPLEMEPERVVQAALGGLGRKPLVIPGLGNRAAHLLTSRLLSRRRAVAMMGRSTRGLYEG